MKCSFITGLCALLMSGNSFALKALTEPEMSASRGQALILTQETKASGSGTGQNNTDYDFFRVGLQANLELNVMLKKLQLGCGGNINTTVAGCDIDIDNFSVSGGGPDKSAVLENPFLEFAIQNKNNPALRQIVGVRFGADKTTANLSFGIENSNSPNGINQLSGHIALGRAYGIAHTENKTATYQNTNNTPLTGAVDIKILNIPFLGTYTSNSTFRSTEYSLNLQSAPAPFHTYQQSVHGNRMSTVNLKGLALAEPIKFTGKETANISVEIPAYAWFPLRGWVKIASTHVPLTLQNPLVGSVKGLHADIDLDERLGLVHQLSVSKSALGLSVQSKEVMWPNSAYTVCDTEGPACTPRQVSAKAGWWLALNEPANLGDVTTTKDILLTSELLSATLKLVSADLMANPIQTDLTAVVGATLTANADISQAAHVPLPLLDLRLSNQNVIQNCWGAYKYC